MIKITSILPQHYAVWHSYGLYLDTVSDIHFHGSFAMVVDQLAVEEEPVDEGWIYDEPSVSLSDSYNDCMHYECNANLIHVANWYAVESSRKSEAYGNEIYTIRINGQEDTRDVVAAAAPGEHFSSKSNWTSGYYEDSWPNRGWVEEVVSNTKFYFFYRDYQGDNIPWLGCQYHYTATHFPEPGQERLPTIDTTKVAEYPMNWDGSAWWEDPLGCVLKPGGRIPTGPLAFPRGRPAELIKPWETPSYEAICWFADQICAFGDLSARAAETVKALDINSIAYLKDFAEFGKLAKDIVSFSEADLGKDVVKKSAKLGASAYLQTHYGTELTVKDTLEIADAIDNLDVEKFPHQRIGAQQHFNFEADGILYSCDLRLSGYIESMSKELLSVTDTMKRCKRALYEADVVPSLENLWDMIPYSFVMDWFVPIGDGAEHLETKGYLQTLPVESLFYSRKLHWAQSVEYNTPAGGHVTGSAVCDLYYRQCTDQFHLPPFRVDLPTPQGISGHWIEASAILVQNL